MEHFFAAPAYIQVHALSALLALLTGPLALYRKRKDIWHKSFGYVWMAAMVATAISSFWISSFGVIGPFSPIHLLSIWTLFVVIRSVQLVRQGNIQAHAEMLKWLYWGGLWVAFALNFLPNRLSNRILFGQDEAALAMIAAILAVASAFLFASRRKRLIRRFSAG